jgi:competence protein ComEC
MSGSDPGSGRERPDLRLLPLVGPLWMAQAAVLLVRPSGSLVVAAVGSAVVLASLAVGYAVPAHGRARARPVQGGPQAHRSAPSGPGRRTALLAALMLAGLGLGTVIGGVHLARLHPPLLREVVTESSVIVATVRVTGDPAMHVPADDGGRVMAPTWSVPARLQRLTVRGSSYSVSVPVLLRGNQVEQLRYGAQAVLAGRAQQSWAPESYALSLRVLGEVSIRSPPGAVARVTTTIRGAFQQACAGLPPDAAALLLGLAVGDESLLSPALDDAMIRSGLAHLTAVSGSNTSLVVGIALAVIAAAGLGWRVRVLWCVLVLAGYVALVRPQPSVLRAAAMGLVALLAMTTGGRRRGPPALLAAALVLLVALPQFAVSLGFALSFAATAGLLVVGPPLADRLARWPMTRWAPEPIRAALAVATAAHLATLPLAVLMGNGASLVALPANMLVTPLVPVATVLGLAAALLAPVAMGPAVVLAHLAAPATAAIAWTAHTSAAVPGGVLDVPAGPVTALISAGALAAGGVMAARGQRPWRDRRVLVAVAVVLAAVLVVRTGRDARWPPAGWVALACDVGQGDALLLRPEGSPDALLVDVGPDGGLVAGCLRDAGVRRLVVLLSHFHADHIDGLSSVLADWPVAGILVTSVLDPEQGASDVLAAAGAADVPVRTLRAGDRMTAAGIELSVLWPARRVAESPANNGSLVALAEVPGQGGPVRVLLTGDIEPEAQAAVMSGPSPGADVVKVPHHGSRHQVPRFASWAGTRIALVTVGEGNDYGHPSAATLQQYRDVGAVIGRTDQHGALAVVTVAGHPALVVQR